MLTITKENLIALCSPIVYIFLRDNEILYVGSSRKGITRPLCPQHHVPEAKQECTLLQIFPCETYTEALRLESELIIQHRPKYNGRNRLLTHLKTIEPLQYHDLTHRVLSDMAKL